MHYSRILTEAMQDGTAMCTMRALAAYAIDREFRDGAAESCRPPKLVV